MSGISACGEPMPHPDPSTRLIRAWPTSSKAPRKATLSTELLIDTSVATTPLAAESTSNTFSIVISESVLKDLSSMHIGAPALISNLMVSLLLKKDAARIERVARLWEPLPFVIRFPALVLRFTFGGAGGGCGGGG